MSNVSSFIKFTPVTGERACEECGVNPAHGSGPVCNDCYWKLCETADDGVGKIQECFFCGGGVGPFAEEEVCFECYCEVLAKEDPSEHRYTETPTACGYPRDAVSDDMPF